jgi:acyl carrier protein
MLKASNQKIKKQQSRSVAAKRTVKKIKSKTQHKKSTLTATTQTQSRSMMTSISSSFSNTLPTTFSTPQSFSKLSSTTISTPLQSTFHTFSKSKFTPSHSKIPMLMSKRSFGGWGYTHFTAPEVIEDRIMTILRTIPAISQDKLTPKANFYSDLGLDSLQQVELIFMLEQEFSIEIPDDDAVHIASVPEAVHYFSHSPYTV